MVRIRQKVNKKEIISHSMETRFDCLLTSGRDTKKLFLKLFINYLN